MKKQQTSITVSGKTRTLPYVATPRGDILVHGSAWTASNMGGDTTNSKGAAAMLSIFARVPDLQHKDRELHAYAAAELSHPSFKFDNEIYLTPTGAKMLVDNCNSGRMNVCFYKNDSMNATEVYETINSIKGWMRILIDTTCAAISQQLPLQPVVGVEVPQQAAADVVAVAVVGNLDEPSEVVPPIIDSFNALQQPVTVSLEILKISPLELAEISIESATLQWRHTLPFVTTEMQQVLVQGAAWTALIIGRCDENMNTIAAVKLADVFAKQPMLFHENRILDDCFKVVSRTNDTTWQAQKVKIYTI